MTGLLMPVRSDDNGKFCLCTSTSRKTRPPMARQGCIGSSTVGLTTKHRTQITYNCQAPFAMVLLGSLYYCTASFLLERRRQDSLSTQTWMNTHMCQRCHLRGLPRPRSSLRVTWRKDCGEILRSLPYLDDKATSKWFAC